MNTSLQNSSAPAFSASVRDKWKARLYAEKPTWFLHFEEKSSLECVKNALHKFPPNSNVMKSSDIQLGAMQQLFASYINEIWISEFPPDSNSKFSTSDVVDLLFEGKVEEMKQKMQGHVRDPDRTAKKLRSLLSASQYLFGKDLLTHAEDPLSVELIRKLHQMVGEGTLSDAGAFRAKPAGAYSSTVVYCLPPKIEARLTALVSFANETVAELQKTPSAPDFLKDMFLLATLFMSEFLLIHPFSNGNGRMARLLTNYLLRNETIVPFSLYYQSRDVYIQVLEERSYNSGVAFPKALATYVLLCAEKTAADLLFLMMDSRTDLKERVYNRN